MNEKRIEHYLGEGEELVWLGKAKENDVMYCKLLNILPFVILWLIAECVVLGVVVTKRVLDDFNIYYLILIIATIVLHIIPTAFWFIAVAKENARVSGDEYAITNKRIIIKHPAKHDSIEYFSLEDVYDLNVSRSFGEAILGTGRIIIETDEEKIVFHSLEDVNKVFRKVYKVIKGKADNE